MTKLKNKHPSPPTSAFQAIFEESPVSTQIFSSDGTLIAVNKAWEELVGVTLKDIKRYNILEDKQLIKLKVMPHIKKAFNGQSASIPPARYVADSTIKELSNSEYRWTRSLIYPVKNDKGQIINVVLQHEDMTESKRKEQDAKVHLRVLESMVEGVNVSDEDGVMIYTNPAEDAMFGYKRGELLGQHVMSLNAYPPKENKRIVDEVIQQLLKKGHWSGEWSNKKKDGTAFTTSSRITSIELNGKKHWVCVQEDITDRKKAEERQKFLEKVGEKIGASLKDMITLKDIAQLAIPFLADYCRIAVLNKNNEIDEITVNHNEPAKITLAEDLYKYYKNRPEMTHGVQRILQSGKSEMIGVVDEKVLASVKGNPQLIKTIKQIGLKSYMGVPLIARGKAIGAMTFSSIQDNRYYTAEDLKFAEELAHRIALALENTKLFKEAQNEIRDRKNAENKLLESTEQYKRLIDLSPMPMAVHTAGTIVYTNEAAVKLIGAKSSKELIGQHIMQFIHPDYQKLVKERVEEIYKEKKRHTDLIEEKFIRLDGSVIEVEIASLYIEYEGKPAIQVIIRDITESKKAEEALRKSELRFRTLIEQSTDATQLINTKGETLYISESIKNVLGYTSQELLGKKVAPFIHPEDLPFFTQKLERLIKNPNKRVSLQFRVKHKDGSWAWIETTGANHLNTPNINAIVGNFRNITKRKEYEEELRYQKTLLEAQREVAPEGVLVVSSNGRMVSYNNRFVKMWHFSEDLMAHGTDDLALQEASRQLADPETFMQLVREAYKSHRTTFDRLLFKDGRVFDRSGSPVIGDDGTDYGYVWFFQDVTERVRLEQQKDEFLGIASHELKTPVTSLKAFGQVLQNRFAKAGDEKSVLLLGKMDAQINKLTYLIQDLLDISKIEGGRLQFHNDYFYFDELIDEIVEEVQRTTDKHQLIREGKTGKTICGDKDRIGQVITNFLTNAIKYSPHSEKILIHSSVDKKELTLCVEDFGVGIPQGNIPHIFKRFYRVKGKSHDTVPGMGLGLYISSEIITRQGGHIWAESKIGKGSRFCFALPIKDGKKKQQRNTLVREEMKHG